MNNKNKTHMRKRYPINLQKELIKLWEDYDFVEMFQFFNKVKKAKGKILQTNNFKFRSQSSKELEYFDKNTGDKQWRPVNNNSLKTWSIAYRAQQGKLSKGRPRKKSIKEAKTKKTAKLNQRTKSLSQSKKKYIKSVFRESNYSSSDSIDETSFGIISIDKKRKSQSIQKHIKNVSDEEKSIKHEKYRKSQQNSAKMVVNQQDQQHQFSQINNYKEKIKKQNQQQSLKEFFSKSKQKIILQKDQNSVCVQEFKENFRNDNLHKSKNQNFFNNQRKDQELDKGKIININKESSEINLQFQSSSQSSLQKLNQSLQKHLKLIDQTSNQNKQIQNEEFYNNNKRSLSQSIDQKDCYYKKKCWFKLKCSFYHQKSDLDFWAQQNKPFKKKKLKKTKNSYNPQREQKIINNEEQIRFFVKMTGQKSKFLTLNQNLTMSALLKQVFNIPIEHQSKFHIQCQAKHIDMSKSLKESQIKEFDIIDITLNLLGAGRPRSKVR